MDGDEVLVLLVGIVASITGMVRWYLPLSRIVTRPAHLLQRGSLALAPPACLALLLPVLLNAASHEVTDDPQYVLLFEALGGAWLGLVAVMCAVLGVGPRDDAIERANPAAAVVVIGAMLGGTLVYAGANVGEGATIWMTIGPAVLATAAWFVLWAVHELTGGVSESIAVDRDVASAVRLAGLLVATGAILGRAVAGDYHSAGQTVREFDRQGWIALPLTIAATIIHLALQPRPRHAPGALFTNGVVPAIGYVAIAAIDLAVLGPWEGALKHR